MTLKVLYIASNGRSGSTLLSRLLGEAPHIVNVGEMARFLYNKHAFERNLPCECGRRVSDCEFWQTIIPSVEQESREFATELVRIRYLPLLAFRHRTPQMQRKVDALFRNIKLIFTKVAEKSGRSMIVDSSKNPAYLFTVMGLEDIELYVLHLVKDPRDVVASWSKPKQYVESRSHFHAARDWLLFNWFIERLARNSSAQYRFLRYEDFVQNPAVEFQKIVDWVSGESVPVKFLNGNVAMIKASQHSLAGNPDKFETGKIEIRSRGSRLPLFWEWMVSIMTLPYLLRYKYPFIRQNKTQK